MKVSIFGLGYVGCVSAACLAQDGHDVIGVDVNPHKVELINAGQSPIVEPGLDELLSSLVQSGKLRASLDSRVAVNNSQISLICVGTPSNSNGSLDLRYMENVCREIGLALADKQTYHVVVVRSTVLPGTVQEKIVPLLEQYSNRKAGIDFGVCMNPEFMREGSAIKDYYHPSFIIIGELEQISGDAVEELYHTIEAPLIRTNIQTAEMVKYVSNAFHALKVVFANEIGNLCKIHNIDGQEIMDIFGQDRRLNISTAYLKPGFSFGGSCLPKDMRALLYRAKERDLELPVLSNVLLSNQRQTERGIALIENTGRKKVGVLGLSFKAGTDDVRESPTVTLVETLVGRGYQVRIYDDKLELSRLIGANKSFLEQELPHITSLMCASLNRLIEQSEVIVLANASPSFYQISKLIQPNQILIDLVGIAKDNNIQGVYKGICW